MENTTGKSITDIIRHRKSVRNYSLTDITKDTKEEIKGFLKKDFNLPFKTLPRVEFIDSAGLDRQGLKKLGTYGIINGARYFIAGIAKKVPQEDGLKDTQGGIQGPKPVAGTESLVDLGFAFEEVILKLTSMGFGTCWLGGTFNRAGFESRANLIEGEVLAAVSPLGYKNDKRSLMDSVIRGIAGSKNRKPREMLFFVNDFSNPAIESESSNFNIPLEMVRVAPSASNKQPWRIVLEEENGQDADTNKKQGTKVKSCHFFLSRTPNYKKISFIPDLQMVDIGIAMCHFALPCAELGIKGRWEKAQKQITDKIAQSYKLNEELVYVNSWHS
jgi:nitroreductase